MSDKKRIEGMNEELESIHADDMEETEEVIVFTKEEFEALMAEEGINEDEELDEVPVFAFANADPYHIHQSEMRETVKKLFPAAKKITDLAKTI